MRSMNNDDDSSSGQSLDGESAAKKRGSEGSFIGGGMKRVNRDKGRESLNSRRQTQDSYLFVSSPFEHRHRHTHFAQNNTRSHTLVCWPRTVVLARGTGRGSQLSRLSIGGGREATRGKYMLHARTGPVCFNIRIRIHFQFQFQFHFRSNRERTRGKEMKPSLFLPLAGVYRKRKGKETAEVGTEMRARCSLGP